MSSKASGYAGLILIIGAVYLFTDCSGDDTKAALPPHSPQSLYRKAKEGDSAAFTRLINAKGKEAGTYQEKLGDDLQWSKPEQAEKCWAAATANGVQDSGPEWAYLYYTVKYWELSVGILTTLLLLCLYLLFRKKTPRAQAQPRPQSRRTPQPQPQQQAPLPKSIPGGRVLIIDTNIWMDERLHDWFRNMPTLAKRHNWTLHIEKIVLGELKGLSNNENKERAGNARMGMSRMEKLLEVLGKRVRLEDNAIRGKDTHADPVLIRMAADIPNSLLITNDRELRILAKSQGIVAIGSAEFGNIR